MSDLFEARQTVEEGAQWRGSINIMMDGDHKELTIRQLRDPEFWEVMSLVDRSELEALQEDIPEDKLQELRDLRDADELDEEDEARLESLQDSIEEEDIDLFDTLSYDTFRGIQKSAKYGLEPDSSDKQRIITEHAGEIDEQYGRVTDEEATEWAQHNVINPMIERATNFESFTIGMKVLTKSIGDTGNSKS